MELTVLLGLAAQARVTVRDTAGQIVPHHQVNLILDESSSRPANSDLSRPIATRHRLTSDLGVAVFDDLERGEWDVVIYEWKDKALANRIRLNCSDGYAEGVVKVRTQWPLDEYASGVLALPRTHTGSEGIVSEYFLVNVDKPRQFIPLYDEPDGARFYVHCSATDPAVVQLRREVAGQPRKEARSVGDPFTLRGGDHGGIYSVSR